MAARTPGLQARSQYHAYWGQFADPTQLPNASGAALAQPEFAKLEVGDVAFSLSDNCRYVCTDVGTVGGADATWLCQVNVSGLVRDAHQIVVAQSSAPFNATATEADILDPGDGTGLQSALAASAALGFNADVRLRPCLLVLTTGPLTVQTGTRLIGAGLEQSFVGGATSGDQGVFIMQPQTSLEELTAAVPDPAAATAGSTSIVVTTAGQVEFRRVRFSMQARAGVNPYTVNNLLDLVDRDSCVVDDCDFDGTDLNGDGAASIGILVQSGAATTVNRSCLIKSCTFQDQNTSIQLQSDETSIIGCSIDAGDIGINIGVDTLSAALGRGIIIADNRIITQQVSGAGTFGILMSLNGTSGLEGSIIDGNAITPAAGSGSFGISLTTTATGTLDETTITGNTITGGPDNGVSIGTSDCNNTLVVGNTAFQAATPITDNGTLSEVAHNIV